MCFSRHPRKPPTHHLSVLDYSSTVWDPYLQTDIDRLESMQRRAARFVDNDNGRKTSVTELKKKLDWKPLSERRREQDPTLWNCNLELTSDV
jgi:hypothetical protein